MVRESLNSKYWG